MRKLSTKELNQKTYSYILDCIDSEGYDVSVKTDKEKLQFLYDTFVSEQGYNIKYYNSEPKAFQNWIMGLPSCFTIKFTNFDILELYKIWHDVNVLTEKQEQKILDNYWDFITVKTFQLFKKFKINQNGNF